MSIRFGGGGGGGAGATRFADDFKGGWLAGSTYASGEIVRYNGTLFVAESEPVVGVAPGPGGVESKAGIALATSVALLNQQNATRFTVTSAIRVTHVRIKVSSSTSNAAISVYGGIASALGATPTWMGRGQVAKTVNANELVEFELDSPVDLVPSTTYYLTTTGTVFGYAQLPQTTTGPIVTTQMHYGASWATTAANFTMAFELLNEVENAWATVMDAPATESGGFDYSKFDVDYIFSSGQQAGFDYSMSVPVATTQPLTPVLNSGPTTHYRAATQGGNPVIETRWRGLMWVELNLTCNNAAAESSLAQIGGAFGRVVRIGPATNYDAGAKIGLSYYWSGVLPFEGVDPPDLGATEQMSPAFTCAVRNDSTSAMTWSGNVTLLPLVAEDTHFVW